MARFNVKYKLKGRPNRGRPDETLASKRITLGSRPLADIYVPDRLVAQEAVAFQFDGNTLQIEVLFDLAGVFVNGSPVEGTGPVPDGASVQIGHTLVEVAIDYAEGVCTLSANEGHLPGVVDGVVKRAKPETPFALVDPGPQEHRWGKNPLLRKGNWAAVIFGCLILAAFPFLQNSEAMTRGELASVHQASHGDDAPQECSACHSPFSSDYGPKCAECHEGLDSPEFHPFGLVSEYACSECHADHRGADAGLIPDSATEKDEETGWPRMCLDCHGVLEPGSSKVERKVKDKPGESAERWLLVDGFSHKDHRIAEGRTRVAAIPVAPEAAQVPIECAECHISEAQPGALVSPIESAEFALVSYEQCLACHADWSVPVHGRDDDGQACYVCHADAATPADITTDLKTVMMPPAGSLWMIPARTHDFDKDDCKSCHVLPKTASAAPPEMVEKVFRHDHHLPDVNVPTGTGLVFSETCMPCHKSVADSETLEGVALVDTSGCVECHTDGDPQPAPRAAAFTRPVTDMFHRVHTVDPSTLAQGATRSLAQRDKLSQGCVACHTPVSGEDRMGFREGTLDCTACHERHANIGQGRCVLCHVDREFEGNKRANGRLDFVYQEEGIFNREKAVTKTTLAIAKFDHRSPGHVDHACSECHDAEAIDVTERVLTAAWPAYDEASCVKCHALERYHR